MTKRKEKKEIYYWYDVAIRLLDTGETYNSTVILQKNDNIENDAKKFLEKQFRASIEIISIKPEPKTFNFDD
jgi:hypothetical protein